MPIIALVISMTVNGMDVVRREVMPDMAQCWNRAAELMTELNKEHGENVDYLGVGCVIYRGEKT